MREPTYFILAALQDGPLHGYAIAQAAQSMSKGRVRLTAGTLYGALDRLAAERQIEPAGEEIVEGRRRRSYRLTGEGQGALAAEAARMRAAAALVPRAASEAPA